MELILVFFLLWVGLIAVCTGGSRWLQTWIYNEPTSGLYWRGPLAGTVLALLFGVWAVVDRQAPGQYTAIFLLTPTDEKEFRDISIVTRKNGKDVEERYRLQKSSRGRGEYRSVASPPRPLPRHPEAIIVQEDGRAVRFEPERDTQKRLKIDEGQSLRYVDSNGRVMSEDMVGRLSVFQWDRFWPNFALNVFHFLLWFTCLWLVLRFQWVHAMGLACVSWLVFTLLILPMLLGTAERSADRAARPSQAVEWPQRSQDPCIALDFRECA